MSRNERAYQYLEQRGDVYGRPDGGVARRVVSGAVEQPSVNMSTGARAGNAERARTVEHLSQCYELGYLDQETFHARVAAANEAITKTALNALCGDLEPLTMPEPKVPLHTRLLFDEDRPAPRRTAHALLVVLGVLDAGALSVFIAHAFGNPASGMGLTLLWTNILLGLVWVAGAAVSWIAWEAKQEERRSHMEDTTPGGGAYPYRGSPGNRNY